MTLDEAVEEVKLNYHDTKYDADEIRLGGICNGLDEAIATILNAVVKGELK